MLLLLRAKRTLLARPGTESLVWRNVLQHLHREADLQGGEEQEHREQKELHKAHSGSPDISHVSVMQKSRSIRQRINLKVNVG